MKLQYLIDQLLSTEIKAEPYVDRYGGVTQVLIKQTRKDGKIISQKYPVACDVTSKDCNNAEHLYHNLVPDDSKNSVVYWEVVTPMRDVGPTSLKKFNTRKFQGTARLVVWLNLAALGDTCKDAFLAIPPLEKILTKNLKILSGAYQDSLIRIRPKAMVPHDINAVFGKYDYNKHIPFYLYPYDYFAIDVVFELDQCLSKGGVFPINPSIDCPNDAGLTRCEEILQGLSATDKNECILPTYDFSSVAVQDATTAQQQTDIIDWICVAPAVTQYTMSFDAINESINAYNKAAYSAFDWNVPFSFSVWVKFTDTTNTQAILAKRTGGFIGFLFLLIGGNITVTMRDTGSTGIVKATNSTTLVNNTWYQLGLSYDGSTNASGLNISVDGVDAPTTSTSDTLGGSFLNSSELSFGQSLSALYLGGKLGYIRAWNIELSAADKLADYNSGVMNDTSIQAANLVMGWKSGTGALFGTVNWLFGDIADETESPASIGMDYPNRTTDLPA